MNDCFRRLSGTTVVETRRLKADIGYRLRKVLATCFVAAIALGVVADAILTS